MACGGYLGHVGVCVSPCFSQQLVLRSRCRDRWRRAKFSMRISRAIARPRRCMIRLIEIRDPASRLRNRLSNQSNLESIGPAYLKLRCEACVHTRTRMHTRTSTHAHASAAHACTHVHACTHAYLLGTLRTPCRTPRTAVEPTQLWYANSI